MGLEVCPSLTGMGPVISSLIPRINELGVKGAGKILGFTKRVRGRDQSNR